LRVIGFARDMAVTHGLQHQLDSIQRIRAMMAVD
jgi:hypothetical protein